MKKEEDKKSFVLYNEQKEIFDSLSDEQAGKLIRAIFEYEIEQKMPEDPLIKIAFIPIKQALEKNKEKWEEARKKKSEAGRRGMESRWGEENGNTLEKDNSTGQSITENNKTITQDNTVIKKITEDNSTGQSITGITDNVNVNVNDIKEKNIKREKNFVKPSLEEIEQYCTGRNNGIDPQQFFDFYEAKNWFIGKNKMKDWQACIRTWERNRKTSSTNSVANQSKKKYQDYKQRDYDVAEDFYDDI